MNVSKLSTGIALLLISMVTVTSQVAWLAAVVAALLALSLGLLAVLGDVAPSTAVVAGFDRAEKRQTETIKPLHRVAALSHTVHNLKCRRSLPMLRAVVVHPHPPKF